MIGYTCVGTNDLSQYVLAMDRGNPAVAAQVEALVVQMPARPVAAPARLQAPAPLRGIRLDRRLEVALDVLLAGEVGAPGRGVGRAVGEGAQDAPALGVGSTSPDGLAGPRGEAHRSRLAAQQGSTP